MSRTQDVYLLYKGIAASKETIKKTKKINKSFVEPLGSSTAATKVEIANISLFHLT